MLNEIMEALLPVVLSGIGALLTLFIGIVSMKAKAYFGIRIEEKHMNTLHRALMTGAERILTGLADGTLTRAQAVNAITDYVKRSSPQAVGALVKDGGLLREMAEAKIEEVLRLPGGSLDQLPDVDIGALRKRLFPNG